jgi:hypothetical protein
MTCPDSSGKWESAVIDMLALDYYVGFALNKISCNINTAKRSAMIKINELEPCARAGQDQLLFGYRLPLNSLMKWITRERPKIDRIACPWLIKKFVDKDAEFIYVPFNQVIDKAKELNAIPFDIPGIEVTHYNDQCTFDYIVKKYYDLYD